MDKDITPAQSAVLAASGVLGGNIARHNIANLIRQRKERGPTEQLSKVKDKLKPGDIFFSRSPRSESPLFVKPHFKKFKFLNKIAPEIREQDLIRLHGGDQFYHAGIYIGNGKVIHAKDEVSGVKRESLNRAFKKGSKIHFYRTPGSAQEKNRAVSYARKFVGKPYLSDKDIMGDIAKEYTGPRAKTGRKCTGHVCTTLVTEAYPKQFKKHWDQPQDMMGKLELVAKTQKGKAKDLTLAQKIPPHVLSPIARSMKFAVPAAGLAYVTKKIIDKRKATKE